MGFRRLVVPDTNIDVGNRHVSAECELVGVRTVGEALDALLE
jgi:hypothetical protein